MFTFLNTVWVLVSVKTEGNISLIVSDAVMQFENNIKI